MTESRKEVLVRIANHIGAEILEAREFGLRLAGHSNWNPFDSNDDAFQLAVRLHMTCRFYMGNACAQATVPGGPAAYEEVSSQADPMAGARLAIVNAASKIAGTPLDPAHP